MGFARGLPLPAHTQESVVDDLRHLTLYSTDTARTVDSYDELIPKGHLIVKAGEEVVFSYGAHSDDTLLAEYGFVIGAPANTDHTVDVSGRVERLFQQQMGKEEYIRKKGILQEWDYWG